MAVRVGSKHQHLVSRQPCQCCDPRLRAFTNAANADLSRRGLLAGIAAAAASLGLPATATDVSAQTPSVQGVLFENVRIFDGTDRLSEPSNVLTVGRTIRAISREPVAPPSGMTVRRIGGNGRTLIPGLIDSHVHMMFATVPQVAVLTADIGFVNVAAVKAANEMLLRGFTSVRDLGGPVFGLKRGIDQGLIPGPRIWPSGAFIAQSGGHGDFRLPTELPAQPGQFSYSERIGGAAIADGPDTVRQRARE